MPNWCITNYVITGREDEVAAVHKTLQKMNARKSLLPNDWGSMWLGNIVRLLKKNWQKVYCRGWITDFNLVAPDRIDVSVESAWHELDEVRMLVQSNSESLRIYYQSEEPGMCIFQTNDTTGTYFPERYLLDFCDEERNLYLWEYFTDLEAAADYISENCLRGKELEPTMTAINAALDQEQEEHPDAVSFMFEEFDVVED